MSDPNTLSPDELLARLQGYETLNEVTQSLAAEIDQQRILQAVSQGASRALNCERASVFIFDEARQELYSQVALGLEIQEIRHSVQKGISGYVARSRRLANVPDPQSDARWNSGYDRKTGFHTRNLLAVPVILPHADRLLGVLELINKRGRGFDTFDEQLATAFSQHAAVALDRMLLVEEVRKRDATQASLNIAREVQRGFMPSDLPQVPGYEMATWWFPNEAVGGDYCDVISMRDGRLGLIIADVSGHGLGPALIMASVRAGLRTLLLEHDAAETLLSLLGRSLADDLHDGRFITMVFAALDTQKHTVEFANAGHSPAIYYRRADRSFTAMVATGLPLGVLDRPEYPQGPSLGLDVGDMVVLCTDGIVEAMDDCDRQFGIQRLEELIDQHAADPVQELVEQVGRHVSAHYVGDTPPDDLTILAVRRNQ